MSDTRRVFEVEVTFSLAVLAEDSDEAEMMAKEEYAAREVRTNGLPSDATVSAFASPLRLGSHPEWETCIPWGEGKEERTVGEILKEGAA